MDILQFLCFADEFLGVISSFCMLNNQANIIFFFMDV
jgi:hypothetical protein